MIEFTETYKRNKVKGIILHLLLWFANNVSEWKRYKVDTECLLELRIINKKKQKNKQTNKTKNKNKKQQQKTNKKTKMFIKLPSRKNEFIQVRHIKYAIQLGFYLNKSFFYKNSLKI